VKSSMRVRVRSRKGGRGARRGCRAAHGETEPRVDGGARADLGPRGVRRSRRASRAGWRASRRRSSRLSSPSIRCMSTST
jgi:hypothetical protein